MDLSRDLLGLANQLARLGNTRPKQVALRRAISTAYYAVFHFLIEQTTKHLAGVQASDASLRAFLARGISHSGMKNICKSIGNGNWPPAVERRLGKGALLLALMAERRIEETVPRSVVEGACLLCSEDTPRQ